jgi:hypothetical protein
MMSSWLKRPSTNSRCFHHRGFLSLCDSILKRSGSAPPRCSVYFECSNSGDQNAPLPDGELTSKASNSAPMVKLFIERQQRKRCGGHAVIEVISDPSPTVLG